MHLGDVDGPVGVGQVLGQRLNTSTRAGRPTLLLDGTAADGLRRKSSAGTWSRSRWTSAPAWARWRPYRPSEQATSTASRSGPGAVAALSSASSSSMGKGRPDSSPNDRLRQTASYTTAVGASRLTSWAAVQAARRPPMASMMPSSSGAAATVSAAGAGTRRRQRSWGSA
ncbi:MAG: hypothetical protein R2755_01090 [Acidimicrobiales bacterium]